MNREELDRRLRKFAEDPRAAMMRIPEKIATRGAKPAAAFSARELAGRRFVTLRDRERSKIFTVVDGVVVSLGEVLPGRAAIELGGQAEAVADQIRYKKLSELDAAGLTSAKLPESPWSDDYWAIYTGILGKRYADPQFPRSFQWEQNHEYVLANPASDIVRSGDAAKIDTLSPSEKYDLVVGDAAGTLTKSMWATGQQYHDRSGEVETWMGICHGWAPAAYMLGRPVKTVTVAAADRTTKVKFYPSDIKALASLLWANANTVSRFAGGRCNDKDPPVDEVGRTTSARCFDINPGAWHLAVVNQIAVAKRSMVMDATFDYEVWNQPIYAYEYSYFNPKTMTSVGTLAEATVKLADLGQDKFKKYRGANARSLAGISMTVRYVAETSPSHAETDSADRDSITSVDYDYDVELDEEGRVIGGEWYLNAHPDFLWTPPTGARARSPADGFVTGEWGGSVPVPDSWRRAAPRASASGMPLSKVVEHLIRFAND